MGRNLSLLYSDCVAFSWASLNGDPTHVGVTVCTLYNSKVPNNQYGNNQIFCTMITPNPTQKPTKLPSKQPSQLPSQVPTVYPTFSALTCPEGTYQPSEDYNDILSCGLTGCEGRYS